jgi:hypothetical protein
MALSEHVVTVNLIVKDFSPELAERTARDWMTDRLNEWFLWDQDSEPPHEQGSLLLWNIKVGEDR